MNDQNKRTDKHSIIFYEFLENMGIWPGCEFCFSPNDIAILRHNEIGLLFYQIIATSFGEKIRGRDSAAEYNFSFL